MSTLFPLYDGCYYATMWGQAFAWTQLLPSIISLTLTVLTFVTSEWLFAALGYYLHGVQFLLWAVQLNLQVDRPNPLCQEYHSYAFPSIEAYYIGALVMFIVGYTYGWSAHQAWYMWIVLLTLFVVPPTVLVFFAYNSWSEVVSSLSIGVITSTMFIILLWVYIYDGIPYITRIPPFNWLHYKDSYIYENALKLERKCQQIDKALNVYRKRR